MSISTYVRTMSQEQEKAKNDQTILCALVDDGEIALVRVKGRGNFGNSMPLKRFASRISQRGGGKVFVIDLHECEAMDSTFMGILAGICIDQAQTGGGKTIVVNANEHCQRLLKNLGLTHILELRKGSVEELERAEEKLVPYQNGAKDPSKLEQICLTLQAHKDLIKVDEENEVRFQAVIEYLEKSLKEEGGSCETG